MLVRTCLMNKFRLRLPLLSWHRLLYSFWKVHSLQGLTFKRINQNGLVNGLANSNGLVYGPVYGLVSGLVSSSFWSSFWSTFWSSLCSIPWSSQLAIWYRNGKIHSLLHKWWGDPQSILIHFVKRIIDMGSLWRLLEVSKVPVWWIYSPIQANVQWWLVSWIHCLWWGGST